MRSPIHLSARLQETPLAPELDVRLKALRLAAGIDSRRVAAFTAFTLPLAVVDGRGARRRYVPLVDPRAVLTGVGLLATAVKVAASRVARGRAKSAGGPDGIESES